MVLLGAALRGGAASPSPTIGCCEKLIIAPPFQPTFTDDVAASDCTTIGVGASFTHHANKRCSEVRTVFTPAPSQACGANELWNNCGNHCDVACSAGAGP